MEDFVSFRIAINFILQNILLRKCVTCFEIFALPLLIEEHCLSQIRYKHLVIFNVFFETSQSNYSCRGTQCHYFL